VGRGRCLTSGCATQTHTHMHTHPHEHTHTHTHTQVSDFGLCKTLHKVKEDGTPYQMTGNTGDDVA
jgi:hypothetical protein